MFLVFLNNSYYYAYTTCQFQEQSSQFKPTSKKQSKLVQLDDPNTPVAISGTRKGTVAGAVALIIGTSIGSGILALPQKTSPAVIW